MRYTFFPVYLDHLETIREAFQKHLQAAYGAAPRIVIDLSPRPEFGELALPFSFELARTLRRPPRKIAEEVCAAMRAIPGVKRLEPAGRGYVNVFVDRGRLAAGLQQDAPVPTLEGKVIVEHTNINPNKAAHIGHLRNAALGDTFVRILRARGRRVEVQNYIDNTGVQVGDVVVGFEQIAKMNAAAVEKMIADPAVRFDYYCWDLYAQVSKFFAEDKSRLTLRGVALQAIEAGEGDTARLAEAVVKSIVGAHIRTMLRIGVEYDLLPRESEILHLKFWEQAFEQLKARGAIVFENEGKNKGCWVMPSDSSGEAVEEGEADDAKIIVRSNGTVTYVGKDIAYQLWKFGLLGREFRYVPFHTYAGGHTLWMTTASGGEQKTFGGAVRVYNVIDARQMYLQNIVAAGLRALGYEKEAGNSVHFSYEIVALSPRCCRDMGIELTPEEQKKPYIEVSGRKGLGVKVDDLLDTMEQRALEEVRARHADRDAAFQADVAHKIAVGALRFFLLKFTRNAVIAFDFAEALNFEGETGPYVQYAAVRALNIQRKAEVEAAFDARFLENDEYWQLLFLAAQADAVAEQALAASEPALVAKYAFGLAQSFNAFYHRHHILRESDEEKKRFLLWLAGFVRGQLTRTLDWLGIDVPEVM